VSPTVDLVLPEPKDLAPLNCFLPSPVQFCGLAAALCFCSWKGPKFIPQSCALAVPLAGAHSAPPFWASFWSPLKSLPRKTFSRPLCSHRLSIHLLFLPENIDKCLPPWVFTSFSVTCCGTVCSLEQDSAAT
jgi:hypothetical protein